jgi:hypothetical protein
VKVFLHHLYEYRKGLRPLVLHTLPGSRRACVEARLLAEGVAYEIHELANGNINVFFGAAVCVAVVKAIGKDSLAQYSPEEDFILGTMLGYERLQQCERYMLMRKRKAKAAAIGRASRSEELSSEQVALPSPA